MFEKIERRTSPLSGTWLESPRLGHSKNVTLNPLASTVHLWQLFKDPPKPKKKFIPTMYANCVCD